MTGSIWRFDRRWGCLLVVAACWPARGICGGESDWPAWRHDAGRTGASSMELAADLQLQWKRELPPPAPTFPNDQRMSFDRSYEPVVAGKLLFLPSMVSDSVSALDTATGHELWTFFAEGPVRFAPLVWQDKVYFVSDDGFLYCVSADRGRLIWKFSPMEPKRHAPRTYSETTTAPLGGREIPAQRTALGPALKLLGDERLISRWPARGGPVLVDGIVYFAAGIWPFEGVAVCAADAVTGKPLWVNTDCAFVKDGQFDHGIRRDGGMAPQGYLAVLGEKLIVPCGRALPGFFDPATGRMEPYTSGWGGRIALAKGCWYACGVGDWLFQSGDLYQVHAAADQSPPADEYMSVEDCARQMNVPLTTLEGWIDQYKLQVVQRDGRRFLFVRNSKEITYLSWDTFSKNEPIRPGEQQALQTRTRLLIDPNNAKELWTFREPVFTQEAFYYSATDADAVRLVRDSNADRVQPKSARYTRIVACDLARQPQSAETAQGRIGGRLVAWRGARFEELWSLPSPLKVHIKAGRRLYAAGKGSVAAVDIPDKGQSPQIAWQGDVAGTPSRLLAADGKLFVVTLEGSLYCFGSENVSPKMYRVAADRAVPPPDDWTGLAKQVLQQSGARDGYAIALGYGKGRLVHELVRQSQLRMIVFESDPKRASEARRSLFDRGLYGSRVHVLVGDLSSLRPAPYLAGLVVSEEPADNKLADAESIGRLFALLRPYGGTACLSVSAGGHEALARRIVSRNLPGAVVAGSQRVVTVTRRGALPEAADWAHESGDAAHTYASDDRRVAPSLGVLWFAGGLDRVVPWVEGDPPCLPGQSEPLAYAGAGPRPRIAGGRMFVAVGDELFASDIYTGRHLWKRSIDMLGDFAAAEDSIYAASADTCVRLDAATGRPQATYAAPKGGRWQQVRIRGDALLGTAGKLLVCLDRQRGTLRWSRPTERDAFSFAVSSDRVFCVDYWSPAHRRREAPKSEAAAIAALDLASGRVLWQMEAATPITPLPNPKSFMPPLLPQLSYSQPSDVLLLTRNAATAAGYRGATGKLLWSTELACKGPPNSFTSYHPPVVLADRFVTHGGEVISLETGQPLGQRLWKGSNVDLRGCGRALGCPNMILVRDGHASYFDLGTSAHQYLRGVRSGCTNSLIPAGGILSAPNVSRHCNCNYPLFMSLALVTMPEAVDWDPAHGR